MYSKECFAVEECGLDSPIKTAVAIVFQPLEDGRYRKIQQTTCTVCGEVVGWKHLETMERLRRSIV